MAKDRELRDSEQAFIAAYTDPNAPTYLVGSKSYKKAHPAVTPGSARIQAQHTLRRPIVKAEIERILEAQGATPEKSAHTLAQIIDGESTSEVVQLDSEGKVVSRTIAKPRAADRIKAIDLRFKLSGHYIRQQAQADVAKEEYSRLIRDTGLTEYIADSTEDTGA